MIHKILNLSREKKQAVMFLLDINIIIFCLFAAFYLRLGSWSYPFQNNQLLLILIFMSPVLAILVFIRFGLYRDVIRYVGFEAVWRIAKAVSLYAILWGIFGLLADIQGIPRSIILINWLLALILIASSRLFSRWLILEAQATNITNILIYGAGSSGRQLSIGLRESKKYKPVAFIDDSKELFRHSINGLIVYSQNDLKSLINKKNIKEVLLAIPSLKKSRKKEIISLLQPYPVKVRSVPSMLDLISGKVKVNDLLEINVNDLLNRDIVKAQNSIIKKNISKKVVLVTGAGGSIGGELCRQILLYKPKTIVLYDISESALYRIDQELIDLGVSNVEILPVIGSVLDKLRLIDICQKYSVQTIYHAAAYKHVPLVEFNQSQGVLNNAIGTLVVAEAAIISNVKTFVLVSTDKAVRPTNVMGASKRIAELILQALAKQSNHTCFTMVRFGNVIDSSGSVIPLFKKQIKAGGPITVTDYNVVRYFMTIPEAVELIIQAGSMAKGGEVFLLDMGKPIRIDDLAKKMIKLSGLQVLDKNNPEGDIEIKYVGLRPGEKLYEELLINGSFSMTKNKLIMQAEEEMINWDKLEPMLIEIKEAAINSDNENIYKLLELIVPQFNPRTINTIMKKKK